MLIAFLALSLAAYVPGTQAQLLSGNISEWFWLSSIAVGDFLYINGGESREPSDGSSTAFIQIDTIAIDITQSWTNQTLAAANYSTQPDAMTSVRQPVLFYDAKQNVVGRYGGWPYDGTDMPSTLWTFEAGSAAMDWEMNTAPSANGLTAASKGPFAPANTYTDSAFYSFGGNIFPVDGSEPQMTVLSGLVTQDFASQGWANNTAQIPNQKRFRTQARAVTAPGYGAQGYIVVLGGESPPTEASVYETGNAMVAMSTITLYDIATGDWHTQTATGDIPPPRSEFCAVGAETSDGQYFDIFVYGGSTSLTNDLNGAGDEGYLNVYVLSLPAFHWVKSPSTTPARRACHTCSVIGNRQMISIGGRLPSSVMGLGAEQDPWVSSIGVFDMTALAWADHYNAAAEPYESPDLVKGYYNSSYQTPTWGDSTLASVFAYTAKNVASNTTSGNTTPSGSGAPSATCTSGDDSSCRHSSNNGAIAGGVVGGLAVLALVLGLGFWFMRRRRRRRDAGTMEELSSLDTKPATEVDSRPSPYEADSRSRLELDGAGPKPTMIHELPGSRMYDTGVGTG